MDVGNLLHLPPHFAHDTSAGECLGPASAAKCESVGAALSGTPPAWPSGAATRQKSPLDDLTRVLLFILLEASKRILEFHGALLDGIVMVLLVLFPHLVPFVRILRFVPSSAVLDGEVSLDKLQPDLTGMSFDLGRVDLDLSQLGGIFDSEENMPDIFVRQIVSNALKASDMPDANRRGDIDQ